GSVVAFGDSDLSLPYPALTCGSILCCAFGTGTCWGTGPASVPKPGRSIHRNPVPKARQRVAPHVSAGKTNRGIPESPTATADSFQIALACHLEEILRSFGQWLYHRLRRLRSVHAVPRTDVRFTGEFLIVETLRSPVPKHPAQNRHEAI